MFIVLKQIALFLFIGVWTQVFIPLSKLTYGAYLGGLSIQLLQVASMQSPTYFNDSFLVSNKPAAGRVVLSVKIKERLKCTH